MNITRLIFFFHKKLNFLNDLRQVCPLEVLMIQLEMCSGLNYFIPTLGDIRLSKLHLHQL